jgi:hypothetical protein
MLGLEIWSGIKFLKIVLIPPINQNFPLFSSLPTQYSREDIQAHYCSLYSVLLQAETAFTHSSYMLQNSRTMWVCCMLGTTNLILSHHGRH